MKNIFKLFVGLFITANFIACSSPNSKAPKLETNMDSVSYVIGVWTSAGLAGMPDKDEIDLDLVSKGIADGFKEGEPLITKQEQQTILRAFSMEQQQKQAQLDAEAAKANIEEGKKFLEENKSAKGVVVTESGLQYRVIKEGTGAQPVETDKVKVHYTGKLLNGDVFDSSHDRGEPTEFFLNRVIKGWTEGVQLMKEGAIYEFFIPSELAYGDRPAGEKIKANSTLIFEIEFIEVVKEDTTKAE